MKSILQSWIICLLQLCSLSNYAQLHGKNLLKVSGGKVYFGTGDVAGFSITTEFSRNMLKQSRPFLGNLLLGAELTFETGVKQPKVINPSEQEFISKTFNQVANSLITLKFSYYPFSTTFLKGINLAVGPSIGYTQQSREIRALRIYEPGLQIYIRRSELEYINKMLIGYKVSAGYEWLWEKLLIGIRLDFNSYNNGDINTMIGAKVGYRF